MPFLLLFFVVLGFKLRALHLLVRCFTARAMPLVLAEIFFFLKGIFHTTGKLEVLFVSGFS
jgi:hypothetical protein